MTYRDATMQKMQLTVVIPTLNPDQRLCQIADELHQRSIAEIIIVDDGSDADCRPIFQELENKSFCIVLHHPVNYGKGAALRTAFMRYLSLHSNGPGCITADDDGQHCVDDIMNVGRIFRQHPDSLILGKRDFAMEHVPWKSRFGNVMTRSIFRLFAGIRISDTQTGLRAIPAKVMENALSIKGNRFEFETEMLLRAWDAAVPFREEPIQTVYKNSNQATHFHPICDSAKIYGGILKHLSRRFFPF